MVWSKKILQNVVKNALFIYQTVKRSSWAHCSVGYSIGCERHILVNSRRSSRYSLCMELFPICAQYTVCNTEIVWVVWQYVLAVLTPGLCSQVSPDRVGPSPCSPTAPGPQYFEGNHCVTTLISEQALLPSQHSSADSELFFLNRPLCFSLSLF